MDEDQQAEQRLREQLAAAQARGDHRQVERLLAQHEAALRDRLQKRAQAPDRELYHQRARDRSRRPDGGT